MQIALHSTDTPDAQLWSAVLGALDDDPCVPGPHIGVAVTEHVVTLTGAVLSEAERAAAVAAARRVAGVLTVVDDIVVADGRQSDSREHTIALAVEGELARLVGDGSTVQAIVHGRVVTLTGLADDHRQKHALAFAIRDIPGVTWVDDQVVDRERAEHKASRLAPGH